MNINVKKPAAAQVQQAPTQQAVPQDGIQRDVDIGARSQIIDYVRQLMALGLKEEDIVEIILAMLEQQEISGDEEGIKGAVRGAMV